jgi:hypothetical protein
MAGLHVWVYNADLDAKWESPVDYLPVALRRGWELTDPPADEYAEVPAPVKAAKAPEDAPAREAKPSKSTQAKATKTSPKE